jgi:hypothetical protein
VEELPSDAKLHEEVNWVLVLVDGLEIDDVGCPETRAMI